MIGRLLARCSCGWQRQRVGTEAAEKQGSGWMNEACWEEGEGLRKGMLWGEGNLGENPTRLWLPQRELSRELAGW